MLLLYVTAFFVCGLFMNVRNALQFDLFLIEVGYALRIFETCLSCIFPTISGSTSPKIIWEITRSPKKTIYIWKDTISIFCRIIRPISRVQEKQDPTQGLDNDDFEESAWELEIPGFKIHCLTQIAPPMFWCIYWLVLKSSWCVGVHLRGHLFRFQFHHLVSVYISLFNWARGNTTWEAFESPPWGWNNCLCFQGAIVQNKDDTEDGRLGSFQVSLEGIDVGEKGVNLMEYQSIKIMAGSTYYPLTLLTPQK